MCSPTAGGAERMRRALAVERERERRQAQILDRRVLERLEDAQCPRLLGIGNVGDVGHGRGRDSGCGQPVAPVGRVTLSEAHRHECDERLPVPHAIGVRPEALVRDELGQLEHLAEQAEQAIVSACDHQLAVAGGEDLVRRDHREHRSLSGRNRSVREVADEVVPDVAEGRLVERRVDHGAAAGLLTFEQRRDDPEGGPHARPHVDE